MFVTINSEYGLIKGGGREREREGGREREKETTVIPRLTSDPANEFFG